MGTGHRGEGTIQTKAGGLVTCLEVSGMLHLGIRTSFYSLRETGRRTQVDGGGGGGNRRGAILQFTDGETEPREVGERASTCSLLRLGKQDSGGGVVGRHIKK